jgi:cell wall-associated NlpC family hydrolase
MSKRELLQRNAVVEEARTWLRTPFHDCASLKGIGVDCAYLLARVYENVGVVDPVPIEPYSPQWFLHRSEELFIGYIIGSGAREISEQEARAGDCVVYKFGRCFAHGAIVVEWPREIVHAHKSAGCVTLSNGLSGELRERPRRFFSMW